MSQLNEFSPQLGWPSQVVASRRLADSSQVSEPRQTNPVRSGASPPPQKKKYTGFQTQAVGESAPPGNDCMLIPGNYYCVLVVGDWADPQLYKLHGRMKYGGPVCTAASRAGVSFELTVHEASCDFTNGRLSVQR